MRIPPRHDEAPPDYVPPPENVYVFKFLKYDDPVPSEFADKRTGEFPMRVRLVFEIRDNDAEDEWQGVEVSKFCDLEVNAHNQKSIYHVLKALDPAHEPEGGEDLDDYKGKRCRAEVKHKIKDGKTYANIGSVFPLPRKKGGQNPDPDGREVATAGAGKQKSVFGVDDEEASPWRG